MDVDIPFDLGASFVYGVEVVPHVFGDIFEFGAVVFYFVFKHEDFVDFGGFAFVIEVEIKPPIVGVDAVIGGEKRLDFNDFSEGGVLDFPRLVLNFIVKREDIEL